MGKSQVSGHFKFLRREPGAAREEVSFRPRPNHILPLGKIHSVCTAVETHAERAAVLPLCQNNGGGGNTDEADTSMETVCQPIVRDK